MSSTTCVAGHDPAYTVIHDSAIRRYCIHTVSPERNIPIDLETVPECAGPTGRESLVAVGRQWDGGIVDIEVLNPLRVEWAERNGRYAFELTVGESDGPLITVNGIDVDASEWERYPGLEADFTPDGQLVAIRVENAALISRPA